MSNIMNGKELATQIDTKEVVTGNLSLDGNPIAVSNDRLKINETVLAAVEDVPVIEVISQKEYDKRLFCNFYV